MRRPVRGTTLIEVLAAMVFAAVMTGGAITVLVQLEEIRTTHAAQLAASRNRAAALARLRQDLVDLAESAASVGPDKDVLALTSSPAGATLDLKVAGIVWTLDAGQLTRSGRRQLPAVSVRLLVWDAPKKQFVEPAATVSYKARALPLRVKASIDGASIEVDLR